MPSSKLYEDLLKDLVEVPYEGIVPALSLYMMSTSRDVCFACVPHERKTEKYDNIHQSGVAVFKFILRVDHEPAGTVPLNENNTHHRLPHAAEAVDAGGGTFVFLPSILLVNIT